ncbi:conserved protein of unknown function [Agrobacterium pusense]|uniref:Uncharacterized protein n=1 Tax=Agrobacterium pusense TaxID=648995 RepID=U4PSF4_9HYPH|nr:conserved protein of unknown function [Agrobacterium pusense]
MTKRAASFLRAPFSQIYEGGIVIRLDSDAPQGGADEMGCLVEDAAHRTETDRGCRFKIRICASRQFNALKTRKRAWH